MSFLKKSFNDLRRNNYFTLINGNVDRNSDQYIKAKQKNDELLLKINTIRLKFAEGGGERARIRHVHQNKKLLVEDRLRILFDKNKYLEIGYFVGYGQSYGDIARAGFISAIGKISDRVCIVSASDATIKGGTVYPIQLRKQLRIQDCALRLRLPYVFVIDSGGAYLPLQAEIYPDKDHGGRTFYNQAVLQSYGVTVIALVCGSSTAGAAYSPTMCSEMGMVSKSSHIFLGGPPLVKAATGEIVAAEELGGALMHAKVSGCSDHTYNSESDGLMSLRDMISTLPGQTMFSTNVTESVDPLFPIGDLYGLLINNGIQYDKRRCMIMQILARLLDGSSLHEFKAQYGTGLVTAFGRISGYMIGILAGYDVLTEQDCLKGSHFVQLCDLRNIPIVSLVHTVDKSDDVQSHGDKDSSGCLIKAKSSFMKTIATRTSKLITVVIGDAVGIDYICLGGKSMEPEFIFAWPNARFGFTQSDLEDAQSSSILKAAGDMVVDEIVYPEQTRQVVSDFIRVINTDSNLPTSRSLRPVLRF